MPPEWLTYRLGFFYDACHPSLTRQVGAAPFRWLVFLDDRCPDPFREQVEDLAHGAFEPVWGHEDFHSAALPQAIERYAAAPGASHLITSRVDSDDAVARDFVAGVQAQLERLPAMGSALSEDGLALRQLHARTAGRQVRSGLPSRPAARPVPLPDRAPHPRRTTPHGAHDEAQPGPPRRAGARGACRADVAAGAARRQPAQRRRRATGVPPRAEAALRHRPRPRRGPQRHRTARRPGRTPRATAPTVGPPPRSGRRGRRSDRRPAPGHARQSARPRGPDHGRRLRERAVKLGYRPRS